jgi:hypothetical protein
MKSYYEMPMEELAQEMGVTLECLTKLPIQKVEKIYDDFCKSRAYESTMRIYFLSGTLVKAE